MARSVQTCSDHALHVDHNRNQDRWEVVDHDGRVIGQRHAKSEAIQFAIREAQHRLGSGDNVMVCVQEADGQYALAWSSP